ncbi:alpha/beta hydrolase [Clavibacter michiganensis]|uniref:alpha/beta hydrolase n=1 Tax=Clavibacter michiganensis TaxID=28447 RepID=UPI0005B980DB|nr:alpha/beta hydrolase [Clavibacter michiganensis]
MLSRARVVLIASAIVCGLVGVVVAPADGARAAVRPPAVLAGPDAADPATGAHLPGPARVVTQLRDARVSDSALRGTSPVALLAALPELDVPELRRLAGAIPATVREVIRRPPAVSGVASWWARLAPDERRSLAEAMPELVGNLEGIPFDVRDAANRRFLDQREGELHAAAARTAGRGAQQALGRDLRMLAEVREALVPEAAGPARSLLTLDAVWPGRAAVVMGDLATAAYVDLVVPGMYYPVSDRLVDWTEVTARLQATQTTLLGTGARTSGGVAAVAWIGYRTPDLPGIATLALAEEGAERLQDAIQGIQGVRRDDPPHLTVIAHSYGSTAAMLALSSGRASVDALAVVGSPGGAVRDASQLDVPEGRVFVGEAPWDPVVGSSLFGQDPGSASFGAELFGVGGTGGQAGVSADGDLAGAVGHNSYFDRGTESFRNLALIGIDRPVASPGAADAPDARER